MNSPPVTRLRIFALSDSAPRSRPAAIAQVLSQNLGHADVLTTFTSYGAVPVHRQGELIRALGSDRDSSRVASADTAALLEDLAARMRRGEIRSLPEAPGRHLIRAHHFRSE